MSRLWLVRHGPTHARRFVGWTDLPADLSDSAALARLSAALPNAPVVSSDLIRARATADAIQGARPRLPDAPDLRETHFGTWENQSWDSISRQDPDLARAVFETPGDVAPPGGESWNALRARVDQATDRLCAQHDNLIIVAHFGVILTQLQRAGGWSTAHTMSHKIDNLSLSQVDLTPLGSQVICVNTCP